MYVRYMSRPTLMSTLWRLLMESNISVIKLG